MEAWTEIWGGAVAMAGILGVLGVIVAALIRLHKLANRFETVEKMTQENSRQIAVNSECDAATAKTLAGLKQTLLMTTRTNIYNLCKEALHNGFCSEERRKLINDLNTDYKENDGNGDVKDIVKRTFALPLHKEKTE